MEIRCVQVGKLHIVQRHHILGVLGNHDVRSNLLRNAKYRGSVGKD
jgi:hypothetical protein